jgi:hypothetical protein
MVESSLSVHPATDRMASQAKEPAKESAMSQAPKR